MNKEIFIKDTKCHWSIGVVEKRLRLFTCESDNTTKQWNIARIYSNEPHRLLFLSATVEWEYSYTVPKIIKVSHRLECDAIHILVTCKDDAAVYNFTLDTRLFKSDSYVHNCDELEKLKHHTNSASSFKMCFRDIVQKMAVAKGTEASIQADNKNDSKMDNMHEPENSIVEHADRDLDEKRIKGVYDVPVNCLVIPNSLRQDRPVCLEHVKSIQTGIGTEPSLNRLIGIVQGLSDSTLFNPLSLSSGAYVVEVIGGTHTFLAHKEKVSHMQCILYSDMKDVNAAYLSTLYNAKQHNIRKTTFAESCQKARRHWIANGRKEGSRVKTMMRSLGIQDNDSPGSSSHIIKVAGLRDDLWDIVIEIFSKYPDISLNKFIQIGGNSYLDYKALLQLILEGKSTTEIRKASKAKKINSVSREDATQDTRKRPAAEKDWPILMKEKEAEATAIAEREAKIRKKEAELEEKEMVITDRENDIRQKEKNIKIKQKVFDDKDENFNFGEEDTFSKKCTNCEDYKNQIRKLKKQLQDYEKTMHMDDLNNTTKDQSQDIELLVGCSNKKRQNGNEINLKPSEGDIVLLQWGKNSLYLGKVLGDENVISTKCSINSFKKELSKGVIPKGILQLNKDDIAQPDFSYMVANMTHCCAKTTESISTILSIVDKEAFLKIILQHL